VPNRTQRAGTDVLPYPASQGKLWRTEGQTLIAEHAVFEMKQAFLVAC
jgi:hypothetical protein